MRRTGPDQLVRLGVLGDVHAQDELLEAALALLASLSVDAVLCTGDVVDGPGDADRCVQLLQDSNAITVRGNHDRWLLSDQMRGLPDAHASGALRAASRQWLASLPLQARLSTVAGEVLLCHGIGDDDMNRLAPDAYGYSLQANDAVQALVARPPRLVVKGHTHHRAVYATGPLNVLDAGTLAGHGPPTISVLDLEAGDVRWYDWEGRWLEGARDLLPAVDLQRPLPQSHSDLQH